MRFEGCTALVTGGAKGIGRAIADRLAGAGVQVAVIGRDAEALAATGFRYATADVTDAAALRAAIDELGPFDILVNNAGAAVSAPFDVLAVAAAPASSIVRLTWFVVDISDYSAQRPGIGQAYCAVMGKHFPAMSVIGVSRLVERLALVEIEATAVLSDESPVGP